MILKLLTFFILTCNLLFCKGKIAKEKSEDKNFKKAKIVSKDIKLKQCCNGCKCSGTIRQYHEKKFIFRDKIIQRYNNISIKFGTDKKGSTIVKGIGINGPDGKTMYVRLTRNDKEILKKLVKLKSYHIKHTSYNIRKLVNKIFNNKKYDYKKKEYEPFVPEPEHEKQKPEHEKQKPEPKLEKPEKNIDIKPTDIEVNNDPSKNDVEERQKRDKNGLDTSEEPSEETSEQREMGPLEKKFLSFKGGYCKFTQYELKAIEPVGIDRIRRSNIDHLFGKYGYKNRSYNDNTYYLNRANSVCTLYVLFRDLSGKLDRKVVKFLESLKNKIPREPQTSGNQRFKDYADELLKIVDESKYSAKLDEYTKDLTNSFYATYKKSIKDQYENVKDYDITLYDCIMNINGLKKNTTQYNEKIKDYAKKLAGSLFSNRRGLEKEMYNSKIDNYGTVLHDYVKKLYEYKGSPDYDKYLDIYAGNITKIVENKEKKKISKCLDDYKDGLKRYVDEYSVYIKEYEQRIKDYEIDYENHLKSTKKDLDKFVKAKKEYNTKLTDYENIDNYITGLINDPNSEDGKSFTLLKKFVEDIFDFVRYSYPEDDDIIKHFNAAISYFLFGASNKSLPIMKRLKCKDMKDFTVSSLNDILSDQINIRNSSLKHDEESSSYNFSNKAEADKLLFEKTAKDLLKEKEAAKKEEEEEKRIEEELKNEEFIRFKNLSEILGLSGKITINNISSMKIDGTFISENIFNTLRGKITIDKSIGNLIEEYLMDKIDMENKMIKDIRACYGIYIYAIYKNFIVNESSKKHLFINDLITKKFEFNDYYNKLTLSNKKDRVSKFLEKILEGVKENVIECKKKDDEEIKKKKEEQEKKAKEKRKKKINELKATYPGRCGYQKCKNYFNVFEEYEIFCRDQCRINYEDDKDWEDEDD